MALKKSALTSSFVTDDDGATMVEYGFLLMLIAAVCVAVVAALGTTVEAMYATASAAF
jgi:pilus assembly protein Flp/PilA